MRMDTYTLWITLCLIWLFAWTDCSNWGDVQIATITYRSFADDRVLTIFFTVWRWWWWWWRRRWWCRFEHLPKYCNPSVCVPYFLWSPSYSELNFCLGSHNSCRRILWATSLFSLGIFDFSVASFRRFIWALILSISALIPCFWGSPPWLLIYTEIPK